MKRIKFSLILIISVQTFYSCDDNDASEEIKYKYLALGDSYTYGQGVCETCSFPVQLSDTLFKYILNYIKCI